MTTTAIEAGVRAAVTDEMVKAALHQVVRSSEFSNIEDQIRLVLESALATCSLLPSSAVAEMRERCAKVADEAMKSKNLADRSPKHIATAIRALDLSPASGDYVVVPMELALSLTRLADYENDPDGPHHTLSTLLNAGPGQPGGK